MFEPLIAAMLGYYREHPDDAPVREVLGHYGDFAQSVHFNRWIRRTWCRDNPTHVQVLKQQLALIEDDPWTGLPLDAARSAQFETAMANAFLLLF